MLAGPIGPPLPSGDLWFLPEIDAARPERLLLPVERIAIWWLDLLDVSLERIWPEAETDRFRSFQNWKSGKTTPALKALASCFPDEAEFRYQGVFRPAEAVGEDPCAAALNFLRERKGLSTAALFLQQSPRIAPAVAEAVYDGKATPEEKEMFSQAVAERWAAPSTKTVRTVFLFARALETA